MEEDQEVEIVTNKKDDDDRPELKPRKPVERDPTACQFCKHKGEMLTEFQNSFLGYVLMILLFLVLGIFALVFLPFAVFLTRNKVLRCPRCLNKVRVSTLQSLSSGKMSDEVWAFNVGSFGVILTRKYLIYILLVVLTVLGIFFILRSGILEYDESKPISGLTWEQFNQDCGPSAVALDRRKAARVYADKYHQRAISWTGYVQRVEYKNNYVWSHTCALVMEMEGDDREFKHRPSLMVTLSGFYFHKYNVMLENINRGDELRFNATIMAMGNEHYTHHLHGFYLEEMGGHKETVESHMHGQRGRYIYEEAIK